MRSPVLSLVFLSLWSAGSLQSRPVDLSIPSGGHGPIDSRGYAQHWIELTEVDFGQGLSLPLRLNLLSSRLGSHGFGAGLWQSPLLSAGILTRSEKQISILLPCGKVLTLNTQGKNPGRFATPDGEWVGVVKGPRTLVSREDGWELEFDQRGLLFRLRADSGRNILWNRLADGSVRTITEVAQSGIVSTGLTVTWDAATKRITTLEARTAAGVKPWKLAYTGGQRLTQVTFPDRSAENIRYSTDAAGNPMMSITSRSLTPLNYVWDKTRHTLISDGLWTYQFKHGKGDIYPVTTRIGPGGEKEIFHDDFKNGRTLFTSADGTLTTRQNVTAPGSAKGKLATVTRLPAGAKDAITLYQAIHDPQTGMLTEESDALGRKTTHVYELHGPTPHSGVKRHSQINPLSHKTIRDLDTHGNLLASTDPLGHTTRHEYDTQNRRIKTTGPDGTVVETLTYNGQGKVETRTDALGAVTKYGYDAQGNRTSITDALGNVTQDSYDMRGNRTATTNALGHTWKFEHDTGGRLTATTPPPLGVPASAGKANESTTKHTYDPQGRRIRTTGPDGTVTEATTYDAFGRITSVTNALGHVTKFEYDLKRGSVGCASCSSSSQPTRIISPSGRVTERTYDLDHHLSTETIAAGTPEAATTKYSYDLAGNLLPQK